MSGSPAVFQRAAAGSGLAHAPYNWGSSHRNVYAMDVVEPTLSAAREFIRG